MYLVYLHDGSFDNCEVLDILPGHWEQSSYDYYTYSKVFKGKIGRAGTSYLRLNYYDLGPVLSRSNEEWKPNSYKKRDSV